MIRPARDDASDDASPSPGGDPVLEDLIEDCTNRLQAGESIDLEDLAARHPEHADRLRRLLPSLRMMAEVGRSAAGPLPAILPPTGPLAPGRSGPFELGDYRVLRLIGRGGMGVVYEAVQLSLNRRVALKVLPFAAALDPHQLRRFQIEAQAAAQLHHTSIVPVFSVGCEHGVHFYAMQYIEGRTVAALIRDRREASGPDAAARPSADREYIRAVARLGIQAAEALDHAHRQGIIHRDVKPANLLVDDRGGLWITDFGLARFVNEAGLTITGDLIGTLRYMSPEQALAKRLVLDHRTDLYSLGATLYELLTLRPVVDGRDRQETLRRIAQQEPSPPRRIDPTIPRDFETILLKALAREPEGRYATAKDLADDLRRFLEHRPIEARRPSSAERTMKWALRHRTAVVATLLVLAVGIVGLGAIAGVQARANGHLRAAVTTVNRALDEARAAQAETRAALAQSEAITAFLVEALRSPDPTLDGHDLKVVDVLDRAGQRLESSFGGTLTSKAALLQALGDTYYGLGLYDRAAQLHAKALAVRQAVLGPDHPDTLTTRDHLGNDHWCAGRYLEAVTWHEQTLERREAVLGPEHPDTLTSRHNLGVAYRNANRTTEAIAMGEKTARLRERILGGDHPETLRTVNTLATAYKDAGRLAASIALYASNLERRSRALGPDHLDTLQSRNNLGVAYRDAGRFEEAIALFEATLERRTSLLGAEHPHTLFSQHDLGTAYWCAGRYREAIETLERAIRLREVRLGPVHAETIQSRNMLVDALRAAGRHTEAIALQEETLRLGHDALGPDHRYTLQSLEGLASAYGAFGRWDDAERLLRLLVARRRKTIAPGHPRLAIDLAVLGRNLLEQSKWPEADSALRESLPIFGRTMPDDWRGYVARSDLGASLLGQGRLAEAEPLLVEGYEGLEARRGRIPVPLRSHLLESTVRIVRLYESWGKTDAAVAWKERLALPDLPDAVFAAP